MKVKQNSAVPVFLGALTIMMLYNFYQFYMGKISHLALIFYIIFLIIMYYYMIGVAPYFYEVKEHRLIIKRRALAPKVIDLKGCILLTEPRSVISLRMGRSDAIELYQDNRKHVTLHPEDKVVFAKMIEQENKKMVIEIDGYVKLKKHKRRR